MYKVRVNSPIYLSTQTHLTLTYIHCVWLGHYCTFLKGTGKVFSYSLQGD